MCVRQREHGEEVGAVERDVDVAVHHRSVRLDIGDVEEVLVGPAGETDRQGLAETRVSAVAAGDERGFAEVDASTCALEPRDDAIVAFLEPTNSVSRSTLTPASLNRSISSRSCSSCGKMNA